jgi:hypothetical protein
MCKRGVRVMEDGNEPIDKHELIYRRVTNGYFDPNRSVPLSDKAFKPMSQDTDGISVTRARYGATPQVVGLSGYVGNKYYVIEIIAGDIEGIGAEIAPRPVADNPGHAVIPKINARDSCKPDVLRLMNEARKLQYNWYGPFEGSRQKSPRG